MFSDTAQELLEKRYIRKDLGERTWGDVVNRVVDYIIPKAVDAYRPEDFKRLLLERTFLLNSPALVNAGTKTKGLSACYVVPFEDSIEGIATTKYLFMKVAQKGGGCGTTLSHLRPEGMPVTGSTHAVAGGPIRFFNTICEDMKVMTRPGAFKEMAIMGTMSVYHPDIEKFITAKTKEGVMSLATLSVMVTDEFMQKVDDGDEEWLTSFYDSSDHITGHNPVEIFESLTYQAWLNGEPGILFEDTINKNTPYKYSAQYINAVNPCAEQPLPPYGVCALGSIDLSKFYNPYDGVDWLGLSVCVEMAVIFLDCLIDASEWPVKKMANWMKDNRPIGLGVMGLADLFIKLGIAYGSEESVVLSKKIADTIYKQAKATSECLGEYKGIPKNCQVLPEPRRNITLLAIAPTGSLAIIADCSHGIEPIFSPTYLRTDTTGSHQVSSVHATMPYFRSAINNTPAKVVTWKEHIDIQAAWQEYVDAGVSKTINFPSHVPVESIRAAMFYAWRKGCKGIAVYRDRSRQTQVLNATKPFNPDYSFFNPVDEPEEYAFRPGIIMPKVKSYMESYTYNNANDCLRCIS